jgi:NhaP-type Na+/H+ or K+/H+ antiporter
MDALLALTNIAVILLLGMLCSLLAKKLSIPDALVLLLLGLIIGRIAYKGQPLIVFDNSFLVGVAILALVMTAFDSSSRFRLREHSKSSPDSFKLIGFFLLLTIITLTFFTSFLFFTKVDLISLFFSLIFAIMAVATDIDAVFVMLKGYVGERAKKVLGLLHTEAIFNTLLVVIIPFIILDIIKDLQLSQQSIIPLLLFQIIIGLGAGLVIGIIVLKTMQRFYSHHFSPIGLLAAVLLAYILAENLGGNGALAVAALGFLFGSFYVKEKPKLQEFSYMLFNALKILVFVLIGMLVKIPLTGYFMLNSLFIFFLFILSRLTAVFISLRKTDFTIKEKFFMSFNIPKGIVVAVIVFALWTYQDPNINIILPLIVAFMIYSLIISSVVDRVSHKLIKNK